MQTRCLLAVVGKSALELLFRALVTLLLMFLERLFEIVDVDLKSALGGKLHGHLDGEPVGVVKLEACFTAYGIAHEIMTKLFKFLYAALKRLFKPLFFQIDFAYDSVVIRLKLGINVAVFADNSLGNDGKLTRTDVKRFCKPYGAAQ